MTREGTLPTFGAFVISLDFELHWGVRDHVSPSDLYIKNLLGVRAVVPRLLEQFGDAGIAATWATVGMLFAESRADRQKLTPSILPQYVNRSLCPYREPTGATEVDDPLHYAPSLIRAICATPRQELATHTYSHYYCLEPTQTREAFAADLAAAVAAAAPFDVALESIVFPRNQHNPAYDDVLQENGIRCYRGNPRSWMYAAVDQQNMTLSMRGARLLDSHFPLSGSHGFEWREVRESKGICNVAASMFLRPCSPRAWPLNEVRLRRICTAMDDAARSGRIFHLWWHPHNFGVHMEFNVAFLGRILAHYQHCADEYGMQSLAMGDIARLVLGSDASPESAGRPRR